ncbi:MAG: hypothetical protein Q9195_002432 [Heterodermia aff. obscurata]
MASSPTRQINNNSGENGDNGDHGELDGDHNQWKFRAPYKVHDNDPNFKTRYHGAPFQWAAIFHKDDINFTHGHHDLGWYESSEKTCVHKLPCKVSCAYCRTPIMDEGRNMILLFPTLINWESPEERKNFDISCHMFYQRRVVDIPDGKPKWDGINGQSELIEDSPPELMKKRKREIEEEEKNKKTDNGS